MHRFATLFLLLLAAPALAQTPGSCEHGTALEYLDVSDVRAALFNNGNQFFGPGHYNGDGYFVPKNEVNSPLFAANVWVGGFVGGELRMAGGAYLDFEFWPGPLNEGATLPDPNDCSAYDRIWVVSAADVVRYEETGEATADLAGWPVHLGAEVVDGDGIEGNYDLAAGDRPRIFGSQTAFWVMNDVGNEHGWTGSDPIGLEVQVTAFAISSEDPVFDQATFYRYRLVNRNSLSLTEARFTYWVDADLGEAGDEWPGVDTTRSLGFVYNDGPDGNYGEAPPAFGIDLLQGAETFRYAVNGTPYPFNDPQTKEDVYNTQLGLWSDGTPMTASGNGYQTDGPETVWAFPGDPVTGQCWSAICEGLSGMNHRIILTSPAFDLAPGEARTFDVALVFGQGANHLDSITELRAASDAVQNAFDSGTLFPVASESGGASLPASGLGAIYPNPVRDAAAVPLRVAAASEVRVVVYDLLGREVAVLHDGPLAVGEHTLRFETRGLPAGLYLVRAEGARFTAAQRVTVVR